MLKVCKNCNNEYETKFTKSFLCSDNCQKEYRKKKSFVKNNEKYKNKIENEDYVVCAICGLMAQNLQFHIQQTHNLTPREYKEKYNKSVWCENKKKKQSVLFSGENNPGYQHGGKLSMFSENFKDYNEENKNKAIEKMKQTKNENPQNENTKIEYYLKQGFSQKEANKKLSERQSTFSLVKCEQKHGKEKGKSIWLKRQRKWLNSYEKNNYSKISQELFWSISNRLNNLDNIYFAELDKNKKKESNGKNNEYRLKLDRLLLPDFIDIYKNRIIEFDGIYWHGEIGHGNKQRNEDRDKILLENNYKVLHVNENDYKKDKQGTIDKCINFLTQ